MTAAAPTLTVRPSRTLAVLTYLKENWVVLLPLALIAYLVIVPLALLVMMSFREGTLVRPGGWTLQNYVYAVQLPLFWEALRNTLLVATIGAFGTLAIALFFAWLIERSDLPGRNLVWAAILLPVAIPGIFATLGLVLAFSPRTGWINVPLRELLSGVGISLETGPFDIYSMGGLIFLDVISGVTIVFFMLIGPMRMLDPALEDAAAVSGTSYRTTLLRVTLPMLVPALLAAYIYSFISSLDNFEAALVAGLPGGIFLLTTLIYFTVQLQSPVDYPLGAAFSVFFMLIMLVFVFYYQRVVRVSARYATITGKGYRPKRVSLGWWKWPALALTILYLTLQVFLPLGVMLYTSLLPRLMAPSLEAFSQMSLDTYRRVFEAPGLMRAVTNTALLVIIAPTVVMLLALFASWFIVRRRRLVERTVLDGLVFFPHAIPGIIVAIALIMVYLTPPFRFLPIYGTIFIIAMALVIGFLPFTTRIMNGAVIQIHKELEEASYVSGVARLRTLALIMLPLLMPAFLAGWILASARAMRAFSAPLLLGGRGNEVLAIRMYSYWDNALFPEAAAIGMLFVAIAAPLALLARKVIVQVGRLQE
jgi:iron(III) transport system permease protein